MPFWTKYKAPISPEDFFERLIATINRDGVSVYVRHEMSERPPDGWYTELIFNDDLAYSFHIPAYLLKGGPSPEAMAMQALVEYRNSRRTRAKDDAK